MAERQSCDRRRERNRRHAANYRMRKRQALRAAQHDVLVLQEENAMVKAALKETCNSLELLKQGVLQRFGVSGEALLNEHARHIGERVAELSRLDTMLGGAPPPRIASVPDALYQPPAGRNVPRTEGCGSLLPAAHDTPSPTPCLCLQEI